MKRKEVFRRIMLYYGAFTLIRIRDIFQEQERYEYCSEINEILRNYGAPIVMSAEDWQTEFWRNGTSGEIALKKAGLYFLKAVNMCINEGIITEE